METLFSRSDVFAALLTASLCRTASVPGRTFKTSLSTMLYGKQHLFHSSGGGVSVEKLTFGPNNLVALLHWSRIMISSE